MPPCQERYANTHTQMWRKKHGDRPPPSFCPLVLDSLWGDTSPHPCPQQAGGVTAVSHLRDHNAGETAV